MTFFQIKGQAMNASVDVNTVISMVNQVVNGVMGAVPKLVFIVWALCTIALIGRVFGKQFLIKKISTMELIGVCVAFGLVLK